MKKYFLFIVGFFMIMPVAGAQEKLEQVTIEETPAGLNIVLTRLSDSTRWLLKLKPGCPTLQKGQTIGLGVYNSLNGWRDYLDLGLQRRCEINQAFQFSEALQVNNAHRTEAQVTDENGQMWTIFHQPRCGSLTNWVYKKVYIDRAGRTVAKGDRLYVPGAPKLCTINLVEKVEKESTPILTVRSGDKTIPTRVSNVRAIPRKGTAYVYWHAATDNVGVDHYVVGYSPYFMDTKKLRYDEMPGKTETKDTHIILEPLENEKDYYFYVIAVDAAGNKSDLWSTPARAYVQSSIAAAPVKSDEPRTLILRQAYENSNSILFRWRQPPTATRYQVILRADGENEFSLKEYSKTYVRILKTVSRRGKTLELTVSAFSPRGFVDQETLEFQF